MTRRIALALAPLLLGGCTDAQLYGAASQPNEANKMSLQGDLCTDDPSTVAFPVKVLLVMDGTASLAMANPNTNGAAILSLTQRYPQSNYTFAMIQYGQLATLLTPTFTNDVTGVQVGIDTISLGNGDAARSYNEAVRLAAATIEDDILGTSPGVRSRTRYVVDFMAYGPPTPPMPDVWCLGHNEMPGSNQCIMDFDAAFCSEVMPPPADCEGLVYPQMVTDLRNFVLQNGAEDLVWNTFQLGMDARTQQLLSSMSTAGHGSSEVQMVDGLNLLAVDLGSLSSLLVKRELVVYNANAVMVDGKPMADSDGDGLADVDEDKLGTDKTLADTDGDFLSDKVERVINFDPLVPDNPPVCMNVMPLDLDTDQDGLTDCEEALLRTDRTLPDTDGDGIPDRLEVLRGGDPLVNDLLIDSNQDGVTDGDAMKEGLVVGDYNPDNELTYGYLYTLVDEGAKMRFEPDPFDPLAGVVIQTVGSTPILGNLVYDPGPPPTLAWSDGGTSVPPGPPVDVSKGGDFTLTAADGSTITVSVIPKELAAQNMPLNVTILVRQTLRSCFHFDVRNITLVQTLEVPGGRPGIGWNTLATFMSEVPQSTPQGSSVVDEATLPVRYIAPDKKSPNKPFVVLRQNDFLLLGGP